MNQSVNQLINHGIAGIGVYHCGPKNTNRIPADAKNSKPATFANWN
jgi:hypothetical protein